ncbi:MAG TPA: CbtB-domain containing protein [Acidimicrobiales bacterium]|nr:CbtB-domain containing protein [Acidimicrobiales bacterium]
MAAPITADRPAVPAPVPLPDLVPWAILAGVLMLLLLYFVGAEQGAVSIVGGHYVHDFVHDARHVLAFPCH